jgi:Tfp pilus assembly protein PilE
MIELLTVVAILGILAAIAIGAYTRQVRKAHKSEVYADLSNLTLRQKTFLSVNGHYASSRTDENDTYPTKADITNAGAEFTWDVQASNAAYTGPATDAARSRGGAAVHGFDALRFVPEGGTSLCGYATISDWGTNGIDPATGSNLGAGAEPTSETLSAAIFPNPAGATYYANDWFYSFALCDFDSDGVYWAFSTAHYTSDISSDSVGAYVENE